MSNVKIEPVLDNEKVNIVKVTVPDGWVGEHTHPGNQFAVALSPTSVTYKQNGEEIDASYDVGDVIWIDNVTHDHNAHGERTYLMITIK